MKPKPHGSTGNRNALKPACELCLGAGMLEFGDEPPIENSCPRCKPWGDSVAHCAQCKGPVIGSGEGIVCDRCDRANIQRDEDPDFTMDDLEWSEEHQ